MGLFKKANETKSGLKVLGFGATGTAKTTFALSFPEIAAIDSEDGMAWYKGKEQGKNLQLIVNTTSADEVEEALEEIEDEYMDDIKTFVIDSETKIYENQQHSGLNIAETRARNKGQSVDDAGLSQREWGKIKMIGKRIQSSKIKLASQGINIVSIAQEKAIKEKKGENWITVGYEPDAGKGLAYDYDLVLRFFTEKDAVGKEIYKAEVRKDRTGVTKKGDILENVTYEIWRAAVEGKADKTENIVDFKKDIKKDEIKMQSEFEELESLLNIFKSELKAKDKTVQSKVVAYSKEIGVDNPLKCVDLDKMKKLVEYIRSL
ncbi:hypothetical protein FJ641_10600 [Clostridium perfringens]|nr:hypothetical protein [Clostridium perfringens]